MESQLIKNIYYHVKKIINCLILHNVWKIHATNYIYLHEKLLNFDNLLIILEIFQIQYIFV